MNVTRRFLILFALSCTLLFKTPAHGQLRLLSLSRGVSASAGIDCSSDTDGPNESLFASNSAGAFDRSIVEEISGREANAAGGFCGGDSESFSASASQVSFISTGSLQGIGMAGAGKANGALETGAAIGSSFFQAEFELSSPMSYSLNGKVDGSGESAGGFFPGNALVLLKRGETIIHTVSPLVPSVFGDETRNVFAFNGVLSPGNYSLEALAAAGASGPFESGSQAEFDFVFVPEPHFGLAAILPCLVTTIVMRRRHYLQLQN